MKRIELILLFGILSALSVIGATRIDSVEANRIIDEPNKEEEDSTNIQFTFKEAPSASFTEVIKPLEHKFWPQSTSYLYLRDKQIADAIKDFCKMQDVDVVISDKLQKKQQKVHQTFEKIYPVEIWEQLVKSCSLLWFHDGHVLFVYDTSEIETKILKIHPHQIQPLLDLVQKLGFSSSNMGIHPMREGGIIIVSGAPKMIELLESMTESMKYYKNIDMDFLDIRIFKLKHAWAEDKMIGNLTIPGVATMLNNILGKNVEEKSPIVPTNNESAKKIKSIKEESKANTSETAETEKQNKTVLPEGGLITTDTRQNAIIVKDYSKNLSMYEDVINKLDVPLELIEIEAVIVNVNKSCGLSMGLNKLNFQSKDGKKSIGFQPINEPVKKEDIFTFDLKGIVKGHEFMSAISILESQNHSKVLSRPSVITMDNLTAIMDKSQTYYLPVKGPKAGDLYSITGSIKLQVTPHLIKTGDKPQIQLILDIKDESVIPGKDENSKNRVDSSSISTQAIVYEGQSVLVGGYFNEEFGNVSNGVPFLKELPFIGNLFKNTTKNKDTTERLFLITPKIICMSAGEDKFEGLFATPSTLLKSDERIPMKYLNVEKQFPEPIKVNNTRSHRLMGKREREF